MHSILDMLQDFVYNSGKKIRKKAKVHTSIFISKKLADDMKIRSEQILHSERISLQCAFLIPSETSENQRFF